MSKTWSQQQFCCNPDNPDYSEKYLHQSWANLSRVSESWLDGSMFHSWHTEIYSVLNYENKKKNI